MSTEWANDVTKDSTYENRHVHDVYESIASHFSSTRYKPWPLVQSFLHEIPPGSVGVDVGCGNGKYLPVNKNVFVVGSDRSPALTEIAKAHKSHDVLVADNLDLPHPEYVFDFAISIAVVHHLSTRARRQLAIEKILALLKSYEKDRMQIISSNGEEATCGKVLIYVWALEQKSSRRGWDSKNEQDVMVPWVTKGPQNQSKTFYRFYHLYRQGELDEDVHAAGGKVLASGYEKDNWWAIATRRI